MNDVAYWHRKTVNELFQARNDLHQLRTEFERVSNGLNEAVAEANRWQDAYEHAIDKPSPDTIRGWQQRIDDAETRAERAEQNLANWQAGVGCCCADDACDRAEKAEADRDAWRKLANEAEDDGEWLNRKLNGAEDRAVKAERACTLKDNAIRELLDRAKAAEHDLAQLTGPLAVDAAKGAREEPSVLEGWGDQGGDFEDTAYTWQEGDYHDGGQTIAKPIADGWDQLARERDEWKESAHWHQEQARTAAHERGEWKARAEVAEMKAETWEENHRILAKHHVRAVKRAQDAEADRDTAAERASVAEADSTDYLDRATRAEEDRNRIEAQARGWKQAAEARTERDCRDCNDVELDRYAAEQRAAMWWEAAKTLCRRQKYWHSVADWRFDALPRLRHRAERAERDVATLQQLLDHLHTTIHGTTTGTERRS